MEQKLFSGLNILYDISKENPKSIKIKVCMRDSIDENTLIYAIDITMKRYPYFCVELVRKDGQYIFTKNSRPVKVVNSVRGIELNSETSNFHMLTFEWYDNCIIMEVSHVLTDGTGAYEILRTLLYYHCSKRYSVMLSKEGIRLFGDEISVDEWNDPLCSLPELPLPKRPEIPHALNLVKMADLQNDNINSARSGSELLQAFIDVSEKDHSLISMYRSTRPSISSRLK